MNYSIVELATNWYVHKNTNISTFVYGIFGNQVIEYQESIRLRFRDYCKIKLNLSTDSLEDLINYYKKIEDRQIKPESAFIDITELEFILTGLFREQILKKSEKEISEDRFKWSFKNHLKYGDGAFDKNYKGTIIKYKEWYIKKHEDINM